MQKEYVQAVQDLKYWQEGQDFFTCELYSLMAKAAGVNLIKLMAAFPTEAKAYQDWYHSDDPDKFFDSVLCRPKMGEIKE